MLWWVQNVNKWLPYWLETGLGWLTKTGNQAIWLANNIQTNKISHLIFKIHKHHENSVYYHANTYDNMYIVCPSCTNTISQRTNQQESIFNSINFRDTSMRATYH